MRALIVDDQPSVFQYIRRAIPMEELGFEEAVYAEDGVRALELIERQPPDVMLLDIRMPRLDGLGLLAALKERGLPQPMTIILSAYDDFRFAQRAIDYGVMRYLLKPIDPEEMTRALRDAAERTAVRLEPAATEETVEEPSTQSTMERVRAWIEGHYAEDLSLTSMATRFYIDRFQLSRLFKKAFGINYQDYILRVRMEQAVRLMARPELDLAQIARAVGYDDPGYFSSVFRKYHGVSPRSYRKSMERGGKG